LRETKRPAKDPLPIYFAIDESGFFVYGIGYFGSKSGTNMRAILYYEMNLLKTAGNA
jgi:hypothetical protein